MAAAPPAARSTRGARSAWHFPGSYWFPLAALYGAIVLPWSVLGQIGLLPAPAALRTGLGHAHEMLFGFALAVVAGYTLKPGTMGRSALLLLAWALARLAFVLAPASRVAFGLNGLFVAGLALLVAPTYLRASKWSNRSVALVIGALALALLAFHLAGQAGGRHSAVLVAVLLLSTLMFFMGGRILAPAVAGHVRTRRAPLVHVVQPALELAVLCLLGAAVLLAAGGIAWGMRLAGALLLAAAALALVRVLRWHAWLCHDQPDLLALLAGYLWLIAGWLLTGAALLAQRPATTALHAITAGALGTLTHTVMLRTRMFRVTGNTLHLRWAYLGALLLGLAALLRIGGQGPAPLLAASVLWSLAYLLLAGVLLWLRSARARAAKSA
ncbi:NnrS family protein [Comamonas flocculans]|uniref:NnrS family protein n=1 Tax=Comamonas flocculans TaxID=2597701 RepID=A0A5B8RT50_9BURK|nr:NnrS family protein [Comamonas flocculans]QEA12829.1 NnrS family protein [Comamonas flocculans]